MTEIKTLHQGLIEEFGKKFIDKTEVPPHMVANLSPKFALRHYQHKAFQLFLKYWNESFEGKPRQNHQLLFHMATGSGKTLIMAGLMLHLYQQGYRNFLFFVNSSNIIQKTRDNFLNPLSAKYLFSERLAIGEKQFAIREVDNFQAGNPDDLNIVFSTIQGLHMALNNPREGALTYDDFENKKIVLISDEAHHINVDTRRGATTGDLLEIDSWEGTVKRIFEAHPENTLLEFTATIDFSEESLAKKYKPKLIFDYPLKDFRIDGYSKEVKVLQVDLPPLERALQAILLSQYRRKIFEKNKLTIKPVLLFKSKTIKESKEFFEAFNDGIATLSVPKLQTLRDKVGDAVLKAAFDYFDANKITPENLITELKSDFSSEKLIEVNSKEESEQKQIAVNSLESNEYRAVFAVDKLNEGWDVLNLFDIVRLYDKRDSNAGNRIGKTTMSEAQLIGRGARYCPFRLLADQPTDKRKFDKDLENEMRICEELYYHSAHNPKYIQELYTALRETGIIAKETKQRTVKLKESFKATHLFKAGYIFLNDRKKYDRADVMGLPNTLIQKLYKVQLHTGFAKSETAFAENRETSPAIQRKEKYFSLNGFGLNVLHRAMRQFEFFEFSNLKNHLPHLKTAKEFLMADNYLGKVKVEIQALPEQLDNLSADDKLYASTKVLAEIAIAIAGDKIEYKGTSEFKPKMVNSVFFDKTLNFAEDETEDKQFGQSMNDSANIAFHLDLSANTRNWFVFNDCYGTSEEKFLIKYIDKHIDVLKAKFAEVYLVRNERHFKLYNFDDGKALEPDFVLFLVGKQKTDTMHYQVFIEPKGGHLLANDAWKESFLKTLRANSVIEQLWKGKKFVVWGLPFYNEAQRMPEFQAGIDELLADAH
jgi:type III restriction enzyme